jgi:hypothetical protein
MLHLFICQGRKQGSQARISHIGPHISMSDGIPHLKRLVEPILKAKKQFEENVAELIYQSIVCR